MDLGSFGVDQELEQADRLQQQALQLLQHAAQTHPWSQRSADVSSASGMGSPAATVQEQPPSRRCVLSGCAIRRDMAFVGVTSMYNNTSLIPSHQKCEHVVFD